MFKPENLLFFRVFIPDNEIEHAASVLLKEGIIHLTDYKLNLPERKRQATYIDRQRENELVFLNLFQKVKKIAKRLDFDSPVDIRFEKFWTREEIESAHRKIDSSERELDRLLEQRYIREEADRKSHLIELARSKWPWLKDTSHSRFYWRLVIMPKNFDISTLYKESNGDIPYIVQEIERDDKGKVIAIVGRRESREKINKLFEAKNFIMIDEIDLLYSRSEKGVISDEQSILDKIRVGFKDLISSIVWQKFLLDFTSRLQSIPRGFLLFCYIPSKDAIRIRDRLSKEVPGLLCDLIKPPKKEGSRITGNIDEPPLPEPPTKLNNPWILKPFELLIRTFSLPRYRDLDPTPFVAIIFLTMYGFMFGDVGHGSVLVLLGLLFYIIVPSIRDFAALMTAAGLSSVFFGFMFGSFFGIEMKPIWYKPIENIPFTMGLAIGFGIAVLLLGMLFQSIQRFRRRDWLNLFLGPWGVAISSVYGLMLGMSAYIYFRPDFIVTGIIFFITAAFLILTPVILQAPILKLISRVFKRDIEVHGDILESVAEATESGLSYFTNTLSFIRVAAFGLNHAALSAAVFAIAGAIKQAGVPSGGVDIVVGNITVIVLEGMIVGIQCIRLLYYEFFTKFYRGGGIPFQPITNVGLVEEVTGS